MHPIVIDGDAPVLLVADHASNAVPRGIDLGVPASMLEEHVAVDIGTDALTRALAARLDAPAVLAGVSRLVVDLNREPEAPGAVPATSDGRVVPGNARLGDAERRARIAAFHAPYHDAIAELVERRRFRLIVSVHSFTPALATRPDEARPWPVGVLYNSDDRAAGVAIRDLRARGLRVGDNEPYSGRVLNYTMNRHAEARGIPYVNLEVKQDELAGPARIEDWAALLAEVIGETAAAV